MAKKSEAVQRIVVGRLYSPKEAATLIGISLRTLRTLIKRGEIRHVRIGRLVKIADADLQKFIDDRRWGIDKIMEPDIEHNYRLAIEDSIVRLIESGRLDRIIRQAIKEALDDPKVYNRVVRKF